MTLTTIEYACVGRTEHGGRCPAVVTLDKPACSEHLTPNDQVELAPVPTVILVEFFSYKKWTDRYMPNTPVIVKSAQRIQEINKAHQARDEIGTPVFGKSGLRLVSLRYLEDELENGGMYLCGLHVEIREDTPGLAVIILEYKRGFSREIIPDITARSMLWAGCYKKVHVWANPPEVKDGETIVVHTVNVLNFKKDSPTLYLTYAEGIWGATPA